MGKKSKILEKACIVGVSLSAAFGAIWLFESIRHHDRTENGETIRVDTVYQIKTDTVFSKPVEIERYRYLVRTVTDTVKTIDSTANVAVLIPIEQRTFSDTTTTGEDTISYLAYVSGYKPVVDSVQFRIQSHQKTLIVTKPDTRRWSFGVTGGVFTGYDVVSRNFGAGIGAMVGISYKFDK